MSDIIETGTLTIDEIEKLLVSHGASIDGLFYLRDIRQRKLYLTDVVDQITVDDLVSNIIQYNRDDKGLDPSERIPIMLYISSPGGEVDAGFELIDAIAASKTPVYTVNLGVWYSMAFMIGVAGHKRFAMPNSKFLIHDGSGYVANSGSKMRDQIDFQTRVESRIRDFIVDKTFVTGEEYDSKLRVEWYLFADEAKLKGMVDHIVGIDCDIDEVV